jgi:uncharacterized membrane protein YhaH (DUF805 family)
MTWWMWVLAYLVVGLVGVYVVGRITGREYAFENPTIPEMAIFFGWPVVLVAFVVEFAAELGKRHGRLHDQ